ncbi:MAG: InlB B-repeat-containing protein [Anaerolineae bacterium]|nr:InlB B-repeat-containing protein [Anaerolineae bacterium]
MSRANLLLASVFCLIVLVFFPISVAFADNPFPDVDGDGLSNEMESTGWYNLAGGPFFTDPLKADSDGDGLADGEEKLFNTHPLDEQSPGLYGRYENSFLTRQYFSVTDPAYLAWTHGGDRYLMTEAIVVRRGTTFRVGGPAGATLTLSGSGLTALSPVADVCNGGWTVTIPSNSTVGTYTVTVSKGGWSKSIPVYVIFELPSDLTQAQIDAYIYDDDPANLRDEVSVWWRTPEWSFYYPGYSETTPPDCGNYPNSPCSEWMYHLAQGYAQAFWTDQFKKAVFVNHAMPAINGKTNRGDATNAIASWADKEFRVVYQGSHNSWATAMYTWNDGTGTTMDGGACQDNANVFASILRSAGIPAKTFLKDYNKTGPNGAHGEGGSFGVYEYDHAVLIWLDGHWKAARSYVTEEKNDPYYPWQNGYKAHQELPGFGYVDSNSDLIVTSDDKWDWQNGSSGGGMVNTVWVNGAPPSAEFSYPNSNWDYEWYSHKPLEIVRTPYMDILNYETWHGDNWAPSEWQTPPSSNPSGRNAQLTYFLPAGIPNPSEPRENWPTNPAPTGCSPSTPAAVCQAFLASMGGQSSDVYVPPSTSPAESRYRVFLPLILSSPSTAPSPIQLGSIVDDYVLDTDGDGREDVLSVRLYVTSTVSGSYQLSGWMQAGESAIRARVDRVYLFSGVQIVQLTFEGQEIGDLGVDGPYQILNAWVAEPDLLIEKVAVPQGALASRWYTYQTQPYAAATFQVRAASFADEFSHQGGDEDQDGYDDTLEISVSLDVAITQTFQVQGDLYDGQGNYVGHAEWKGADNVAVLRFQIAKTAPPYTLNHLMLLDGIGAPLDDRYYKAYEIADLARVYPGPVSVTALNAADGVAPLAVTPDQTFSVAGVDDDGDGRYDRLVVTLGVRVTGSSGTYRVEGLLVDANGTPVAWGTSDPQTLAVGNRQMTLPFDGKVIHDHMSFSSTTQTFRLIAVKIFRNNLSEATLEAQVPVAITTPAYTRNQFDSVSPELFGDDMERGTITTNNWTAQSPWTLSTAAWRSPTHAWRAVASSGNLTSMPIVLGNTINPSLRLNVCYQGSSPSYLEVSTNGTAWTRVMTYTGSVRPWSAQYVDLSSLTGSPQVQMRFTATTPSYWYVDDVYLNAWPPQNYAAFNYAPQPVLVGANTAFTATYGFVTPTLPITLTWNFGDGSPILRLTNTPTATHAFPQGLDYTVRLTVENGYVQVFDTQIVPVYARLDTYAGSGGSIVRNPDQATYRAGNVVTLTAVANPGAYLTGWSGDLSGTANPAAVTISGNKAVTATFAEAEYHLTVNTVGSGSVITTPALPHYHYGNVVTLTATAAPGWTFDRWSGDLDSTANPVTVTMNADKVISAVFTQNEYTLMTTVSGGGAIVKAPNQPTYHYGDVVTLTATANAGWIFSNWSGDLTGSQNPRTVTINGNKAVTATFAQAEYTLSVNTAGGGTVTRNPNQATYHYGEVVTLTATANAGWTFSGWSGDLTGSQNPRTIVINSNKSVLATFGQDGYTLTANVAGGGTVARSPSQSTYHYGDVVTLTATANTGWAFTGWSGDLTGSQNPGTIAIDGNKTVTANFSQIDYTLTVNVSGDGSVSRNPSQATYHYGDVVNLTATASEGWQFDSWSGDLSGTANPTSITVDGNKTVTVSFSRLGYTLETAVSGGGSITRNPDKPTYLYGEVVTLTAVYGPEWSFTGWSGNLSGTTNPQTLVMDGPKSVIASFSPNGYLLNITLDGSGTVTKNPDKSVYQSGEVVTLTATPATGWTFTGWSGDLSGSVSTKTITMDGDKSVTASFMSDEYVLSVNNVGSGYVVRTPSQSYYYYGTVVTLTATPLAGYAFSGWSGALSGSANPATITIDGNKSVTATYTFVGWVLATNVAGGGSVSRSPDLAAFSNNTVVTLTATANPGWHFVGWSGHLSGTANPTQITMNGNKTVLATFEQYEYTLAVSTVGGGSVDKNPDQSTYHDGDGVTLTAVAAPGWTFAGWSGDLTGTANPESITINGSRAVTATFTQAEYTLAVNTAGSGAVNVNPQQTHYHYGDVVTLTATASTGWLFTDWSGSLNGTANPITLTMDGSKTMTAHFGAIEYSLTANVSGSGAVSKNPSQATYHYGDVVTLTAVPIVGWTFSGWSGDLTGSQNPKTIAVDGNKVVLATFTQDEYTLTIDVVGGGGVASNPSQVIYRYGDVVTLTATANPGWTFSGWSGGLSGSANPQAVAMTGNKAVTATFAQIEYTLTATPAGGGTVSKDPNQATYHYGDVVMLTAVSAPGWNFFLWEGDLSGSANPKSLTINGDKSVVANFRQDGYVLSLGWTGSGAVQNEPDQDYYHYGDVVALTAVPDPGWVFAGWSGDLSGTANPASLTMLGSRAVMAAFVPAKALTGVSFDFAPTAPSAGMPINFAAVVAPSDATPPITYTWTFGDGSAPLVATWPTAAHTFALPGSYTVQVTASNGYGPPVVYSRQVDIAAAAPENYFIYLPVTLKNFK